MKTWLLESDEDEHGLLNNSWEGNAVIISCSLAWLTNPSVISSHPSVEPHLPHLNGDAARRYIWPQRQVTGPRSFVTTPGNIPRECLIETVMSGGRSTLEHRQLVAINLAFATKSVRLLIEWTCLWEIKSGGATVLSYQELMVASQDKCTYLN